jgi:hypothetical protein
VLLQHVEGLVAQQLDVGCMGCCGAGFFHLRAVADHHQALVRHRGKGFDDHRHAFVGHHARGGEVVILFVFLQGEAARVDGRVDHGGFAPIRLGDARADEVRVGDEVIHAGCGALIPHAYVVQDHARQFALHPSGQVGFTQVLVLQVPGVADR